MKPENIKEMAKSRWKNVQEKSYTYMEVDDGYFSGMAGLVVLTIESEPYVVHYKDGRQLVIVDENFHWLQLAPKNENWWLTAMYDEKCEFIQFYFDVTLENSLLPDGKSYMRDLYIDVVLNPDGEVIILDRDELYEALRTGDITSEEYSFAVKTADMIAEKFSHNIESLLLNCTKYLNKLKEKSHAV